MIHTTSVEQVYSNREMRNIRQVSCSTDNMLTRRAASLAHKATQSRLDTKTSSDTIGTENAPPSSYKRADLGVTYPLETRMSLNEVGPKVTALIFILQIVQSVMNFFVELYMICYRKIFTVTRLTHPPPIPTASSMSCVSYTDGLSTYSSSRQTTPRPALPTEVSIASQILWHYMKLNQDLQQSDVILVLGNFDMRTCQYACQLWVDGWAEYIMYTSVVDSKPVRLKQVETFDRLAESMNVPSECVLLETGSTNVIESIANSHKMLKSLNLKIKSMILVHLPFMERLLMLTFLQAWPMKGTNVVVTSPPITLINFPNRVVGSMEQVIEDIAEAVEFVLRYDVASRNSLTDDVREAFHTIRPSNADTILPQKSGCKTVKPDHSVSQNSLSVSMEDGLKPKTVTHTHSCVSKPVERKSKAGNKTDSLENSSMRAQFSQHMDR